MKKLVIILVSVVASLCIVFTALPIMAEEGTTTASGPQSNQEVTPQWGTDDISIKQVSAFTCMPLLSGTLYVYYLQGGAQRYCTSGGCIFECNVDLPTGAKIQTLILDGCDTSTTGYISATLFSDAIGAGDYSSLATVSSSVAAAPGCNTWQVELNPPPTINNYTNSYRVEIVASNSDWSTSLSAIRIGYSLQVSPNPAYASFTDVPVGHWAHQYVEALASSGITTGYADGTYRPGDFVTRGQMATFLSRALGLHWPW